MSIKDTLQEILDAAGSNVAYTQAELDAMTYQLQGSYDNKSVEILSKDLFSIKTYNDFLTKTRIPFFDDNPSDSLLGNVQSGQLPSDESHTVHEVIVRAMFTAGAGELALAQQQFIEVFQRAKLIFQINSKAPVVDWPLGRSFAPFAGVQLISTTLADTSTALDNTGSPTTVDLIYKLSVPKVIGEKVSFKVWIDFAAPIAAGALVNAETKIAVYLGGINIHAR